MVMTDKAYIVTNKQQERDVLGKLEREEYLWNGTDTRPTEHHHRLTDEPITIFARDDKRLSFDYGVNEAYLADYEIEIDFDGRKESKMKISKEVYDALVGWKESMFVNKNFDIFVGRCTIDNFPKVIDEWWANNYITDKENNNRLIAIIRWVNGEDVFEVEKPKKWVVRSKETNSAGDYVYVAINDFNLTMNTHHLNFATRFDTKEEAKSWANAHQEVIEVEE